MSILDAIKVFLGRAKAVAEADLNQLHIRALNAEAAVQAAYAAAIAEAERQKPALEAAGKAALDAVVKAVEAELKAKGL